MAILKQKKVYYGLLKIPKSSKKNDMFEIDLGLLGSNDRHFVSCSPQGAVHFQRYCICVDENNNEHPLLGSIEIDAKKNVLPECAEIVTGLSALFNSKILIILLEDAPSTDTNVAISIYEV